MKRTDYKFLTVKSLYLEGLFIYQQSMAAIEEDKCVKLHFEGGGSDKVYNLYMRETSHRGSGIWTVVADYGRRGSALSQAIKADKVGFTKADKEFNKIMNEKIGKGYKVVGSSTGIGATVGGIAGTSTSKIVLETLTLLNTIEENEVDGYLRDDKWCMQEKYDGHRRCIRKLDGVVTGINRKGEEVELPDGIRQELLSVTEDDFILDGEILGDDMRVFDVLRYKDDSIKHRRLQYRLDILDEIMNSIGFDLIMKAQTTYNTHSKRSLFKRLQSEGREGVVFKAVEESYQDGRPASGGVALKFKFYETASFVVTAINAKRSVKISLWNEEPINLSELVEVGNVTIPPNQKIPKPHDVIEVRYLYAFKGGSVYQPTYIGKRDDIAIAECTMSQLKLKPNA